MKRCSKCKQVKELTEFYKNQQRYRSECKVCKDAKTASWRVINRDRYNKTMRSYNVINYRRNHLQRYDLNVEKYEQMLISQKGVCAICSCKPGGKRPLAVDHCHKTGKVRGLLCYRCNRAIHILDEPQLLANALVYLKQTPIDSK